MLDAWPWAPLPTDPTMKDIHLCSSALTPKVTFAALDWLWESAFLPCKKFLHMCIWVNMWHWNLQKEHNLAKRTTNLLGFCTIARTRTIITHLSFMISLSRFFNLSQRYSPGLMTSLSMCDCHLWLKAVAAAGSVHTFEFWDNMTKAGVLPCKKFLHMCIWVNMWHWNLQKEHNLAKRTTNLLGFCTIARTRTIITHLSFMISLSRFFNLSQRYSPGLMTSLSMCDCHLWLKAVAAAGSVHTFEFWDNTTKAGVDFTRERLLDRVTCLRQGG